MKKKRTKNDPRGYVKIWRKVWDNPVSTKARYLAVFFFIVSHANWKEKKVIIDNKTVTVKRGQWLGSILQISNFFDDIAYTSVYRIVKWLKADSIVDNEPTTKYTLFSVKNYDEYQLVDSTVDNKGITRGEQKDTTKKDNKDKKGKNKKDTTKVVSRKKPYGNERIDYILKTFRRDFDQPPVDKYPRRVAWAFVQNIQFSYKKKTGKDVTDEKFNSIADWLFGKYTEKDFAENTYKLETVRLHSKAFLEKTLEGGGKNG